MDEAQRLALYTECRESFHFFSKYMFKKRKNYKWKDNWHHKVICDALTRVFKGECKRLIINIPPRYSKTELAVVNFIAWALGQCPDAEFIHTSYSGTLAINNSGNAKMMVETEEYQGIFPEVKIRWDSNSKSDWRTTVGGVVYATGAGGTITGFGAGKMRPGFGGAIIIDDPHKADEAHSDTMRNNVIEWFGNTLESRCNSPETPIIIIMQRLHEGDLSGFLQAGGNGEEWESIIIPAINENDEALWEFKHTIEDLHRMEEANPYVFSGQYMQKPSPSKGGLFKPDQLQTIDALPAGVDIKWCRAWDLASTTDGDYTVGAKLGRLPDGRYIIADVVRLRVGPDERDKAMINTASQDGKSVKISIPQDPGQAGKTQVIYLTRELAGYNVKSSPESGDKVTRAEPFAAQVNIGNVMMLRGEWNMALTSEMRLFPNGNNDDQVDALARAFSEILVPRRSFFG